MKKIISLFLSFSMLLIGAVTVCAESNTAEVSIQNDSFIKVGDTVTVNFTAGITAEQAEKITVTKTGSTANLVEDAVIDGTAVTLSFGDNLEYSSAYKLTVPVSAGVGEEITVYFQTYNKLFRGISKMIVDENFNSVDEGALPDMGTGSDNRIGKFASTKKTENAQDMAVKTTSDAYGENGKSLYAVSYRTDAGYDKQAIYLENYNGRIKKNADGKLVISFKFKSQCGRMMDFRIKPSSTINNSIFWIKPDSYQLVSLHGEGEGNYVVKNFPADFDPGQWHEYTSEWDTTDASNMKCVYAAVDGEVIIGTQNASANKSMVNTSELNTLYLDLTEWTSGQMSDVYIDDVKVYVPVDMTAAAAVITSDSADVGADNAKAVVTFTNPVDTASLSGICAVSENGESIAPSEIKVNNDLKYAELAYSGLSAQTAYTVSAVSDIKDVFGNAFTVQSADFTTLDVDMTKLSVSKPVITGTLTEGASLEASAALNSNKTGKDINVTIIFALYDGIKLVDINTASKVFTNNTENDSISVSMDIPQSNKHGNYELRAFVWDSETDMNNLVNINSEIKTDRSARLKQ